MDSQSIALKLIAEKEWKLKEIDSTSMGPQENLLWVTTITIDDLKKITKFRASASTKQQSVKLAYANFLKWAAANHPEDEKERVISDDLKSVLEQIDRIEKSEKNLEAAFYELKEDYRKLLRLSGDLVDKLNQVTERVKALENFVANSINDGFIAVLQNNNNSTMHATNGNIDTNQAFILQYHATVVDTKKLDRFGDFDDLRCTCGRCPSRISVPVEIFTSVVPPKFEDWCQLDEFWWNTIHHYVTDPNTAKSQPLLDFLSLAFGSGMSNAGITQYLIDKEATDAIFNLERARRTYLETKTGIRDQWLEQIRKTHVWQESDWKFDSMWYEFYAAEYKNDKPLVNLKYIEDVCADPDWYAAPRYDPEEQDWEYVRDHRKMQYLKDQYSDYDDYEPSDDGDFYDSDNEIRGVEADEHNREMHAIDGNSMEQRPPRSRKNFSKNAVEKVVEEIKSEPKKQAAQTLKNVVNTQKKKGKGKKQNQSKAMARPMPKYNSIPRMISTTRNAMVRRLLELIMLPYLLEARGYGWPRAMSDVKTCPKRIEQRLDAPWDTDVSDANIPTQFLARTSLFACAFRNLLMSQIIYFVNGAKKVWSYQVYSFDGFSNTTSINDVSYAEFVPLRWAFATPRSQTYSGVDAVWNPHSNYWFPGKTDAYPAHFFYWLGRGTPGSAEDGHCATISLTNNDSTEPMDYIIRALCYTRSTGYEYLTVQNAQLAAGASNVNQFTAGLLPDKYTYGAYVAFEIKATWGTGAEPSPDGYTYSMIIDSGKTVSNVSTAIFGHQSHVALETILRVCDQKATIGTALWYQNTAAPNYKNGNIAVQQVPANTDWTKIVTDIPKFKSEQRTKVHQAVNGAYSYLKPNNVKSFDLDDDIEADGVYVQTARWNIDTDQDFLVFLPFIAESDVGVSQQGIWRIQHSFEFVSNNPLFMPEPITSSRQHADIVLDLLRNKPQHFENKSHLKKIGGFLKSVSSGVKEGLKMAEPFINLLA